MTSLSVQVSCAPVNRLPSTDILDDLRARRNMLVRTYHASKRFLFRYSDEAAAKYGGWLQFRHDCAWEVQFTYQRKIDDLDRAICDLERQASRKARCAA